MLRPLLPKGPSDTPTLSPALAQIGQPEAKEPRRRRAEGNVSLCDGQSPCRACLSAGAHCVYYGGDARRREFRLVENQSLQDRIDEMQAVLDALKFGSREEANQTLEHLRSTAQNAPQADAGADDDNDPGDFEQGLPRLEESSLEMMLLDTGGRQKCKAASSTTTTTTDVPGWIPASFSPKTLPSEQMVRMGSTFYFEVISGLFYVTASENFDSLLDAVYRAEAEPEMTDIAEICAVASVGAHFHPDGVQDELKDALFRTAIQNINELIEVSGVRAIGVLACLSIYGLLEKRRSTRGLIHLGLQLARWEQQEVGGSPSLLLIRKKLHRTMVFLECWLSTSLGYYPERSLSPLQQETEVQAELQRAGECLTMLKASACADRVSQRLHDTLNETYQKVKMLNDKPSERTQVQNGDETDRSGRCGYANGKESLAVAQEALKAMTNILKDPFGHGDKEGLILDFSIMGADTVDWFSSCET
ncbi:hypothetical protein AYO22_11284 [Fonsecaea multimorphosa]|nr:hypothetical protein AYO22_11284 [Fonsecaea multimorphosa]